jgi:hypothetical protein
MRLYIDTLGSPGVKIRYSLLDNQKTMLYESGLEAYRGEVYMA